MSIGKHQWEKSAVFMQKHVCVCVDVHGWVCVCVCVRIHAQVGFYTPTYPIVNFKTVYLFQKLKKKLNPCL